MGRALQSNNARISSFVRWQQAKIICFSFSLSCTLAHNQCLVSVTSRLDEFMYYKWVVAYGALVSPLRESKTGLETYPYNSCSAETPISGKSHVKPKHTWP